MRLPKWIWWTYQRDSDRDTRAMENALSNHAEELRNLTLQLEREVGSLRERTGASPE